jgi:hypothetical protein
MFVFPTSNFPAPPHQGHLLSVQTTTASAIPTIIPSEEPRRITPLSHNYGVLSAQQSVQSSRRNSRDAELMRITMSNEIANTNSQKLGTTESRNNRQAIKAKAIEELRKDISVVMRERAIHGYSMNVSNNSNIENISLLIYNIHQAEKNKTLIRDDRQLVQVWAWLTSK